MFTVEMRINGALLSLIYGRNISRKYELHMKEDESYYIENKDKYEYEFHEQGKDVKKGIIEHTRNEGLPKLVSLILQDLLEEKNEKDNAKE